MPQESVYIAQFGATIARALGQLAEFAGELDPAPVGFQLPDGIVDRPGVIAAGDAMTDAGDELVAAADQLDAAIFSGDEADLVSALATLANGIYLLIDSISQFATEIENAGNALSGAESAALGNFAGLAARRYFDSQIISWLAQHSPVTALTLKLLGLIEWHVVEATGNLNEPRYVKKELRLERIKTLLTDPAAHFENAHGWGTANFDPEDLMRSFSGFFEAESIVEIGKDGDDAFIENGPVIVSRDSNVSPPGLKLDYFEQWIEAFTERAPIDDLWGTDFFAQMALGTGFTLRLEPPFQISLEPKAGTMRGATSFTINRNDDARGFSIVGGNDLVRLTADNFGVGAAVEVGADTTGRVDVNPSVHADLSGLTLSLGSEGSDNFLASLLANADVQGVFDLGMGWSLRNGFEVRATGGIEVAIPMHQDLGPFEFQTLFLILRLEDDGGLSLETSAALTANLGPLAASVERMGVITTLEFADGAEGTFGPIDLSIAFKPPTGVGLSLDAGAVKGGGYLYLDYENGEYAGAMELTFTGLFSVKAIGLINTQMPDGSDGFSMLVIITAEFGTPIQLGYGFTLNGLGGLLGLNRTMVLEEMADGVRTGAIDGIMFPDDVVANAPQIISDMRRFFPPEQNTFVIGPMAKIGWGTPTLVTVSLGVVVEIPPGNVAILGVLKCALPDEDAALLVLQVNFIGAIEVDQDRLWFFASLYGSRVLFIDLTGDMGLLIAWGSNADFVLSVGGFHPEFTPPPMPFPAPARIALSILDESFARISVQGYFAVTSNTAQFGASVELYFGIDAFSVDGYLGFDALFQFSPFYFTITFSASMSVRVFGAGLFSVRIRGDLEGVSPWHVEGEGSISILFWDIDVPFSHTWGDNASTVLPDVDAFPMLIEALEKDECWIAIPPTNSQISVTLREIDSDAELLLHPSGRLTVSQRTMPLQVQLDKVGNKSIVDIHDVTITDNGGALSESARVRDKFATGQYRNLDESAKLSAPGFEDYDAGLELAAQGDDLQSARAVRRDVLQELVTIDSNYKEHINRYSRLDKVWFENLLSSNATARSPLSQINRQRRDPFNDKIQLTPSGFVLADTATNVAAASYATQAEAKDALALELKNNPKASLHVIPTAEAQDAA